MQLTSKAVGRLPIVLLATRSSKQAIIGERYTAYGVAGCLFLLEFFYCSRRLKSISRAVLHRPRTVFGPGSVFYQGDSVSLRTATFCAMACMLRYLLLFGCRFLASPSRFRVVWDTPAVFTYAQHNGHAGGHAVSLFVDAKGSTLQQNVVRSDADRDRADSRATMI